jgi:hypothetical protein
MPYLDRYRQPRGDLSGDRRTVCDKRESVERLALIKRLTGTDVVADAGIAIERDRAGD